MRGIFCSIHTCFQIDPLEAASKELQRDPANLEAAVKVDWIMLHTDIMTVLDVLVRFNSISAMARVHYDSSDNI
jgi:hypothetical protein